MTPVQPPNEAPGLEHALYGGIDWELNPAFTEGVGTVTLYVQQLDTPLVASSRIVRIE